MRLILNVTSSKYPLTDHVNRIVFDHHGGGIGRSQDNDCVLPDPEQFISNQHAVIQFEDNAYLLTDTSVNGVYINDSDQPVGKDNTVRLRNGDCLIMGDYELRVAIEQENQVDVVGRPEIGTESEEMKFPTSPWVVPGNRGDTPEILDGRPKSVSIPGQSNSDKEEPYNSPSRRPATESDHTPVEQGHFVPSSMRTEGGSPDWDRTEFTPPSDDEARNPPPGSESEDPGSGAEHKEVNTPEWDRTDLMYAPVPQRRSLPDHESGEIARDEEPPVSASNLEVEADISRPSEDGQNVERIPPPLGPDVAGTAPASNRDSASMQQNKEDAVQVFLHAAGLNETRLSPEAALAHMKLFGGLYREIVQGLMDVLRARSDLKNEFRMRHTQIGTRENNPLKFSGRVDDALEHLVFNHGSGFLSPEASFQEAFQDIKDHQIAMVVGMRAAFESLLRRFDPEQLEQRVVKGKKIGNLLPVNRKANCWERYEEWYAEISAAADDDFQGVFGDEFTRAYEEQVARLSLLRKKSGG